MSWNCETGHSPTQGAGRKTRSSSGSPGNRRQCPGLRQEADEGKCTGEEINRVGLIPPRCAEPSRFREIAAKLRDLPAVASCRSLRRFHAPSPPTTGPNSNVPEHVVQFRVPRTVCRDRTGHPSSPPYNSRRTAMEAVYTLLKSKRAVAGGGGVGVNRFTDIRCC